MTFSWKTHSGWQKKLVIDIWSPLPLFSVVHLSFQFDVHNTDKGGIGGIDAVIVQMSKISLKC